MGEGIDAVESDCDGHESFLILRRTLWQPFLAVALQTPGLASSVVRRAFTWQSCIAGITESELGIAA